ncbi:MAG: LysM peptidoglycan-binding domain-containing protein [Alicyclobacillus sp.]|nr:LysM peptidoglycan-binding domain-containing protein [Alicyclobacillus sp.]
MIREDNWPTTRQQRLSTTRHKWLRLSLAWACLTAFELGLIVYIGRQGNVPSTACYGRYTVQQGDTVWSIAEKVRKKDWNVQAIEYWIVQHNHINDATAEIYPGETLIIPIMRR